MPIVYIILLTISIYANSLYHFNQGIKYRADGKNQDYNRSTEYFQRSCDALYTRGCLELAHAYRRGLDIPIDRQKALELYHKACELDSSDGCAYLGVFYEEQKPPNYLLAEERYTEACDMGSGSGCTKLALLHRDNRAIHSDPKKFKEYITKACDMGSTIGCIRLAHYNTQTRGSKEDYKKAIDIYTQSCGYIYNKSCIYLADIYRPESISKSIYYLKKACKFKNIQGCKEVANYYKDIDTNISKEYQQKASNLPQPTPKSTLAPIKYDLKKAREYRMRGDSYYRGINRPIDEAKAYTLYLNSCNQGDAIGCYRVGIANIEARGTKQDNSIAREYIKKSCYRGYSYGCSLLGYLYQYGEGVKVDPKRAYRYYNRSCELGNSEGCRLRDSI